MERDYGKELESLQTQIDEMKEMLSVFAAGGKKGGEGGPLKNIHPMRNMHPDPRLSELMEQLCRKAEEDGESGAITYLGVFASGGRQSNWIRNEVSTDSLLALIENDIATTVLACIGSSERLKLLLALLKTPRTVAQMVEQCGYSSTGQVYHHLKPLIAASLVQEDDARGTYIISSHRVQGIIMLLAGISDMLDPKYTQGVWEPSEKSE